MAGLFSAEKGRLDGYVDPVRRSEDVHFSRRASELAGQLIDGINHFAPVTPQRARRPVLVQGLHNEGDLGAMIIAVAAFAAKRPELRPDPRLASKLTGSLIRSVRRHAMADGTSLADALVQAGTHLRDGDRLSDSDEAALHQLAAIASQDALAANQRAYG